MLLEIKDLNIQFETPHGMVQAVEGLTLQMQAGEILGLVGESGSGKSVTALSIMQLLPATAHISGEILFAPKNEHNNTDSSTGGGPLDLVKLPAATMRNIRGSRIAMIFQEPMSALNPVFRCGKQITEAIRLHQKITAAEARDQTYALFEKVKLADPARIFQAYPNQLSGGQKQRVMIAMALSCKPDLLLADEPTTALDVTVQRSILDLLIELKTSENLSMLFISHDLGVIGEIADYAGVMSEGQLVETGAVEQVLKNPQHPYTKGLVACRPSLKQKVHRLATISDFLQQPEFKTSPVSEIEIKQRRKDIYARSPILETRDLSVQYPVRRHFWGSPSRWHQALDNVSLEVFPGEIFGLAGESGCGKTTLGKVISRLHPAHDGTVWFRKLNLNVLPEASFRTVRREIQMVFQDPYASLNPRMTIGDAVLEPIAAYKLGASRRQRADKVAELLETVGLEADHARRFPRAFSGGQRQRICLARALALQPKLLVCDEIVSALDVSVQATILNLLLDLQEKFGLTLIFISHDLSIIRQMCDRVMVMNQGKVEAIGHPEALFEHPQTPYIRSLVESIPGY
ncbi:MAG: ABC transporter ATP-binding protein [Saprospiraceae bacterium]